MADFDKLAEEFEFAELMRQDQDPQLAPGAPNPDDAEVKRIRDQIAGANKDAIKDLSFGEATLTSLAREADKLKSGAVDIYHMIRQKMGDDETKADATSARQEIERQQKSSDVIHDAIYEEHPTASIAGSVLPYVATLPAGIAASGVRGGAAAISRATGKGIPKLLQKKVAKDVSHIAPKVGLGHASAEFGKYAGKEAAIGAGEGAIHYDDTALSGAAFGAGGAAGGKIAGNIFGGNYNVLSKEDQRIVDFAKKNKLYVPPGMATGDVALQQMDGALATHRLTTNRVSQALTASKRKENSLLTKEIADRYDNMEPAEIISNKWMEDSIDTVKKRMDEIAANTMGEVNDDLALRATDIAENYKRVDADQTVKPILRKWEDRFLRMADGKELIDGKQYQQWTHELKTASRNNRSTNAELSFALDKMSKILDDAIEEGLDGAKKGDWGKVRRDYAMLQEIDKLKDTSRIKGVSESGHVDMQKLAKKFHSSPTLNKLSEVQRLRKVQSASSLGTSAMLGRAMVPYKPSESVGAWMLMGSRMPKGLPVIPDALTSMYMSGYPHATGALPIFGKNTTKAFEAAVPRSLMTTEFGEPERDLE